MSVALILAAAVASPALAELVVTRLPQRVEVTPGAYVIDRADIERRGAVFAADALIAAPGLSVFRNGAFGGVTSVRQRGASADKTLVLIDGVPVNDASQPDGPFDFKSLDLADIERIEVLSGPQGSLWGSDAIGGVIAFTTRELDGARASGEVGAYDTARGSVSIGRASDGYAFGLTASGFRTDGISKADGKYGNVEPDGFRSGTVSGYGRLRLTEAAQVEARLRYNAARVETDGVACVANCTDASFANDIYRLTDTRGLSRSENWSGLLRARVTALGLKHTFSLDGSRIARKEPQAYEAERTVYRWNAARGETTDPFAILVGAEYADAHAELASGQADDLGLGSAFVVGRFNPAQALTLTGSLRYDDPRSGKGELTARAGAAYEIATGLTLSASYGEGFKTPTVSQIVCDFCFPAGPSIGLRPEKARGKDVGLAWRSADGSQRLSATVFRLSVRDQIAYTGGRYRNIARTLSKGLELQGETGLGRGFSLSGAYAYLEAQDRTTSLQLLRAPKHSGSASLGWTGGQFEAAVTLRAESRQADTALDGFSRARRPGFVTLGATGAYAINEAVKLTLRVENLADHRHQQVLGYGEPGLSAYVGVALRY